MNEMQARGPNPRIATPSGSSRLLSTTVLVLLLAAAAHGTPRVLVVGLDSGDWDFLDPLMAAGHTPTIAGLVGSGVKADYDCSLAQPGILCFCPMVWTSVYTGWPSSVHGIYNFDVPPSARQVPAIWNVLRDRKPVEDAVLIQAHTHRPPLPEATAIVTIDGALGAADQRFVLWSATPLSPLADPGEGTSPSTLFQDIGMLPYAGPTPTVWHPMASDRVGMDALKAIVAQNGVPALSVFIFHSLDRTMHLKCDEVVSSPDGPVDEAALLSLASAWSGPVEGDLNVGNAASQYLEADLHLAEILALGSWDYVVFTSDHGMILDPLILPCHHIKPQAFAGIFALAGPGVKSGVTLPTQDPLCTAPLIAYLLGLEIAQDLPCVASGAFENDVLPEIFTSTHLAANPPAWVAQWQFPAAALPAISAPGRLLLFALLAGVAALRFRRRT